MDCKAADHPSEENRGSLERYSLITTKMRREFVLLQGTGCVWRRCAFCDYYLDTSKDPFQVNKAVLDQVTGVYGVLDVINSGSCTELDRQTVGYLQKTVREKGITSLWFEAHWLWRHKLKTFSALFPEARCHYRLGIESFSPALREAWDKGIGEDATVEEIKKYYDGVCLLCGMPGQTYEEVEESVRTAEENFSYYSLNLFTPNSKDIKADPDVSERLRRELFPRVRLSPKAEVLAENTDLGVG